MENQLRVARVLAAATRWASKVRADVVDWYRGRLIPPPPDDPKGLVVFLTLDHYEQPALAKLLNRAVAFWLKHWQWIIGFLLGTGVLLKFKQ